MPIPGNLLTTAMAVMPHTDVDRALRRPSLWTFPSGPSCPITTIMRTCMSRPPKFSGNCAGPGKTNPEILHGEIRRRAGRGHGPFRGSGLFRHQRPIRWSTGDFLNWTFQDRPAIRGQLEGPISFGSMCLIENDRPILFDDTVRPFMIEFMAKRVNVQIQRLRQSTPMPSCLWMNRVFSFYFQRMSGYGDVAAKEDLDQFFSIDRPAPGHSPVRQSGLGFPAGTWTWISSPWMSIPMAKSLPPILPP